MSAAGDFQDTFAKCLVEELKLIGSQSTPCIYHDPLTGMKLVFHGDDVAIEGHEGDLDTITSRLDKLFELVVKATLGPESKDDKQACLLDRLLTWTEEGLLWECDPRQIELAIAELGLHDGKAKSTPGIKISQEDRAAATPLAP